MIEELYEKYYSQFVRWCQTMTGNHQTAEELVQEAFFKAMLHNEVFATLDEHQAVSWMYRTIKNSYVDLIRHTSRETITGELPESVNHSEEIISVEWEELLNMLPDMEGILFVLRYLHGYNSRQIGEMFNLPPGTVRFKLSSARKHLREMLSDKQIIRKD